VGPVAAELRDVHPGAEGGGCAGEDDRADIVVLTEGAERIRQLDPQVDGERVPLLGPLQRDDGDLVLALE
jgi:hypothetical protein